LKKISVITPVYNEIFNLERNINQIQQHLKSQNYEIIIVDDNSPDGSGLLADFLARKNPKIKVLHRKEKMGLGTAYKEGFSLTQGKFIVSMDSDLSHDASYLPQMIECAENYDIVIGSRFTDEGKIIGRSIWRDSLSLIANYFIRSLTGKKVKDWTSGLRVYRRETWRAVMPLVNCNKWDFQFESLYKALQEGFTVTEIPITFHERADGKSKFNLSEALSFLKSFIKIVYDV